MTKKLPDRLHLALEPSLRPSTKDHSRTTIHSFRVKLEQLQTRYSRVMGQSYRLDKIDTVGPTELYQLVADQTSSAHLPLQGLSQFLTHSPAAIEQLTATINHLLDTLHATETALWRREAELAAGVPVSQRPDEPSHLADRLTATLRSATERIGGVAAGVYMLDEGTSELKLRASWKLPAERLREPARPLRGATADLEALVGHAVLLKNATLVPEWKIPEDYPAALCVPVSSPTTPLGTLWVFCPKPRDFSQADVELLEIVAGRIAAELEREILLAEGVKAHELTQQLQQAGCRQQEQLPTVTPILDQWDMAAWTSGGGASGRDRLSREFYDWGVLADGRVFVGVGSAEGKTLSASLSSMAFHAALKAHTAYPHSASGMLERINGTLWGSSTDVQFASLFYGLLDPERGELEYAFAGRMHAWIANQRGVRPLTHAAPFLGIGPDTPYTAQRARVSPDESLVICSHGFVGAAGMPPDASLLNRILAKTRLRSITADDMLERLRTVARPPGAPHLQRDATVLIAQHLVKS